MKITRTEDLKIYFISRMEFCMKLVEKYRMKLFKVSKVVPRNHRLRCCLLSSQLYRMGMVGWNFVRWWCKKDFSKHYFFEILEVGKYVAIDFSGRNLRIMLLTLKGSNQEPEQINHNYVFPASVVKGTGDQVRSSLFVCLFSLFLMLFCTYELSNIQTCNSCFFILYFRPYILLF